MKVFKKYLLVFGFTSSLGFFTVYAQSFQEGRSIFASDRPDNEILIPNCTYRTEYNPYMNQYTQNEVCSPRLVGVAGQRMPSSNPQPYYQQPSYQQPRQYNYLNNNYLNYDRGNYNNVNYKKIRYVVKYYLAPEEYYPEISESYNGYNYGYANEDVYNQRYEVNQNAYGYENEDVSESSPYLNEDVYNQDHYEGFVDEEVGYY